MEWRGESSRSRMLCFAEQTDGIADGHEWIFFLKLAYT